MMRPLNLISLALLTAALFLFLAPAAKEPAGLTSLPRLEETVSADGARIVTCDDAQIRAVFAAIGLPEPPLFNGSDPVPSEEIMKRVRAWHENKAASSLGEMGMIFLALEENHAATSYLAAARVQDPENHWWSYFLGAVCQKMGYQQEAADLFKAFADREPSYPTTYARLGLIELERNNPTEAENYYDRCRQLLPRQSLAYVGLGRAFLARGQLEEAIQNLQRATTITTNDFMAWRFLGMALMAADRQEEARQAIHQAETLPQYSGWLQFDPRLGRAHEMARSQRYLENSLRVAFGGNDLTRAHQIADELIRRRPGDPAMLDIKASIFLKAKRTDEALAVLDKALTNDPENAALHLNRGRALFLGNAPEAALDAVNTALDLESQSTAALDLKARTQFRLGMRAEAIGTMEATVALNPKDLNARFALGVMYRETGQTEKSRRAFEAILGIEPNHAQARASLERLSP